MGKPGRITEEYLKQNRDRYRKHRKKNMKRRIERQKEIARQQRVHDVKARCRT